MSANLAKSAEISSARSIGTCKMEITVEARSLIREIAGTTDYGFQIQEMLTLVARKTGIGARRLRGIWNSEARSIRAEEIDALRAAAASRKRIAEEAKASDELEQLRGRIASLEKRVASFYSNYDRYLAGANGHASYADSGSSDASSRTYRTVVEGRGR